MSFLMYQIFVKLYNLSIAYKILMVTYFCLSNYVIFEYLL